jgi:hypothetical protein
VALLCCYSWVQVSHRKDVVTAPPISMIMSKYHVDVLLLLLWCSGIHIAIACAYPH